MFSVSQRIQHLSGKLKRRRLRRQYSRDWKPNSWVLASPNSFGEVVLTCALSNQFRQTHGGSLELFVRSEHKILPEVIYPDRFDRVHCMDIMDMRDMCQCFSGLPFSRNVPIDLSPCTHGNGRLLELFDLSMRRHGYGGLVGVNAFKFMMRLDWDCPLEKPFIDQDRVDTVLDQEGLTRGEYVLFLDSNNTNSTSPGRLWAELARLYINKGKRVIVNRKGAMIRPDVSYPKEVLFVEWDLLTSFYTAQGAYSVIGGNNGLVYLLTFSLSPRSHQPDIHCMISDKSCVKYELLGTQRESEAFVERKGITSTYQNIELVSDTNKYFEWIAGSSLSGQDCIDLANDLVSGNNGSSHLHKPPNLSGISIPESFAFVK